MTHKPLTIKTGDELVEKFTHNGTVNYSAAVKDAIVCAESCLEVAEWYSDNFPVLRGKKRLEHWQSVLQYLKSKI